LYIVYLSKH